jgi:hypothetical protein
LFPSWSRRCILSRMVRPLWRMYNTHRLVKVFRSRGFTATVVGSTSIRTIITCGDTGCVNRNREEYEGENYGRRTLCGSDSLSSIPYALLRAFVVLGKSASAIVLSGMWWAGSGETSKWVTHTCGRYGGDNEYERSEA